MKGWCPYAHAMCENGFVEMKDEKCVCWNEHEDVCLMVEALKGPYDVTKMIRDRRLERMFNEGSPSLPKSKGVATKKVPKL